MKMRFEKKSNMVEIPYADNYFLDEYFNVFYKDSLLTPDSNGNYTIGFFRNQCAVSKESLILLTFKKPCAWTFDYFLRQSVHIVDKDKPLHVDNLCWNITRRGKKFGYYPIPGYSRYGVNSKGDVWDYRADSLAPTYLNKLGYMTVTAWADGKTRSITVFVHRLMALALLDYPNDVHVLTVNHKDGNKLNNDIDNLEWCTKAYNNLHASIAGLRKDNLGILVLDITTMKVDTYPSHRLCAEALGFEATVIDKRAKSKGQKLFSDGRMYLDLRDSGDYTWAKNVQICQGAPKSLKLRNTSTEEILEFPSISSAARHIDVKVATLAKRISEKRKLASNWVLHQSSSLDNNDVSFLSNAGMP